MIVGQLDRSPWLPCSPDHLTGVFRDAIYSSLIHGFCATQETIIHDRAFPGDLVILDGMASDVHATRTPVAALGTCQPRQSLRLSHPPRARHGLLGGLQGHRDFADSVSGHFLWHP